MNKEITGSVLGGAVASGETLPPLRLLVALGLPLWTRLGEGDAWDARKGKLAVALAVATTGWYAWLRHRQQRELRGQMKAVKATRKIFCLETKNWRGEERELEQRKAKKWSEMCAEKGFGCLVGENLGTMESGKKSAINREGKRRFGNAVPEEKKANGTSNWKSAERLRAKQVQRMGCAEQIHQVRNNSSASKRRKVLQECLNEEWDGMDAQEWKDLYESTGAVQAMYKFFSCTNHARAKVGASKDQHYQMEATVRGTKYLVECRVMRPETMDTWEGYVAGYDYMEQWLQNLGEEVKKSEAELKDPSTKSDNDRCWSALQKWMEEKRLECGGKVAWVPRQLEGAMNRDVARSMAKSSESSGSARRAKAPPKEVRAAARRPEAARPKMASGETRWKKVQRVSLLGPVAENEDENEE